MAERRAPFVAVRTDIRKEERVLVIADIAGYSRHEAIGRLVDLWCWCTDRGLDDAPEDCEGYAVSDAVVCRFLGSRGVEAILGGNCDELALGQRRADDLIYLRGTSDTVARLRALRKTASAGGNARSRMSQARSGEGRFVGKRTKAPAGRVPSTSRTGAEHQPESSSEPAVTSEIPDPRSQIQIPDPEAEKSAVSRKRSTATVRPEPPAPGHNETIATFTDQYKQAYQSEPTWDGRKAKAISVLVKTHGAPEVQRRIGILFSGGLAWPHPPYDLDTLVRHFDKLATPSRSANGARASPVAGGKTGRFEPMQPSEYENGDLDV